VGQSNHSTGDPEGAMKFYLAMAAYFVLLLFPATFTMGPQAAIAVTLFWVWIFKSEGRGWGQTAAGIVVLLFIGLDGPMPWPWRDPGLPLWLAFGTLALLPGFWKWRREASPRFEEPGTNEVQG
jgi:ABC-type transport system involved in cytochrome c biogenesis permease subunit